MNEFGFEFEQNYVTNVYTNIAEHFSSTRISHWVSVKNYLIKIQELAKQSSKRVNFLDFGCGNGKYLSFGIEFNSYALDNCDELLKIVKKDYPYVNTIKSDVSNDLAKIGLELNFFDSIISIAVMHHLATEKRRIQMLQNIIQLLKSGGTCMITVWATTLLDLDKNKSKSKSKYVKLNDTNDYLIGWNNQYQRYYHLFESDELESLVNLTGMKEQVVIIEKKFELDNWILILKKN